MAPPTIANSRTVRSAPCHLTRSISPLPRTSQSAIASTIASSRSSQSMGQLSISARRKSTPTASKPSRRMALVAATMSCFALTLLAQAPAGPDLYLNLDLPVAQRVDDLVNRMTLDEKISQMQNEAPAIPRLHIAAYNWWNEGLH